MNIISNNLRIVLIACVLTLSACTDSEETAGRTGYVEADWAYISASQSGTIIERPVAEGDVVNVGDILFELDKDNQLAAVAQAQNRIAQSSADVLNLASGARPAEIRTLEAKLAQAHAQLDQAESERNRVLPLVERGAESSSRGEQVQANYAVAVAAVAVAEQEIEVAGLAGREGLRAAADANVLALQASRTAAQVQLQERTISARVAGKVERVFHQQGEFVPAGSPVFAILPEGSLKIKFFVTQAELPNFQLGKIVRAKADGMSASVEAAVSFIASEAEFTPPVIYSNSVREKLVFLIEATVPPDSNLRPGLPVDVDWS